MQVGDVVQTQPKREAPSHYRVIQVRVQERGLHAGTRHHLRVVRIAAADVEWDDVIHPLYWYPRG